MFDPTKVTCVAAKPPRSIAEEYVRRARMLDRFTTAGLAGAQTSTTANLVGDNTVLASYESAANKLIGVIGAFESPAVKTLSAGLGSMVAEQSAALSAKTSALGHVVVERPWESAATKAVLGSAVFESPAVKALSAGLGSIAAEQIAGLNSRTSLFGSLDAKGLLDGLRVAGGQDPVRWLGLDGRRADRRA